ncbi:MAG TPA: class I SAM-dependent methyltransferase [Opitutaceae bacterium]|nr:class I SAM-dependent methyltransferase [Opitutaceae bacterium]
MKSAEATHTITCRCCGSQNTAFVGKKRGEIMEREFHYYRCVDCSFLFISPYLGPEIYNDAYYRGEGPDPLVNFAQEYNDYRSTDRVLEFNDILRLAREHLARADFAGSEIAWLDFGCGAGGFLKFLRDQKTVRVFKNDVPIAYAGSDVGAWANRLRQQDGFTVYEVDGLRSLPDASFDVISAVEVLEHIPDPNEVMRLLSRLLKPGGLLLLTTGNMNCSFARRKGIQYRYCMSEIHISLFNPDCLARVYRKAGLEPFRVHYKGVVAFKMVKSLRGKFQKALARLAVRVPFVLPIVDWLYGVSAMPCAVKPR